MALVAAAEIPVAYKPILVVAYRPQWRLPELRGAAGRRPSGLGANALRFSSLRLYFPG